MRPPPKKNNGDSPDDMSPSDLCISVPSADGHDRNSFQYGISLVYMDGCYSTCMVCLYGVLHLHGLEDSYLLSGLHSVADFNGDLDDYPRKR